MSSSTSTSGRLCAALVSALLLLTLPLAVPGARADQPAPQPAGPPGSPAPMVVGDLGAPAPGVTTRWVRVGGPWAEVDDDGRFSLSAPTAPAQLIVLQEYGEESSRLRLQTAPVELSEGADLGVLDVPVLAPVTVRVVDPRGVPVVGAEVTQDWFTSSSPVPAEQEWEHAGHLLAGLPVTSASVRTARRTDEAGEVTFGFARTRSGRITRAWVAPGPGASDVPVADAEIQDDGTHLVRVADRPGAVRDLTAVPGDRAVLLRWTAPSVDTGDRYQVIDLVTQRSHWTDVEHLRLPAANGTARGYVVRAVGRASYGPWVASASVTPRRLRVRLVGPRDGAVVRGPAAYRVVSTLPLASLDCSPRRPQRVRIRGCATGRITVRASHLARVRFTVTARDGMGSSVRLRRSFVRR